MNCRRNVPIDPMKMSPSIMIALCNAKHRFTCDSHTSMLRQMLNVHPPYLLSPIYYSSANRGVNCLLFERCVVRVPVMSSNVEFTLRQFTSMPQKPGNLLQMGSTRHGTRASVSRSLSRCGWPQEIVKVWLWNVNPAQWEISAGFSELSYIADILQTSLLRTLSFILTQLKEQFRCS